MLQSETISFTSSTLNSARTEDKEEESSSRLAKSTLPSHGELVEPSQEFQESQVQEPQDPDKLLSVTCAERPVCSPHLRSGETGTEDATSPREDTLSLLPSLPPLLLLLLWPEVTPSKESQSSHSLLMSSSQPTPRLSSLDSPPSVSTTISRRSEDQEDQELDKESSETQDTS